MIFEKDLKGENNLKSITAEGFDIPEKGGLLIPLGHVRSTLEEGAILQAIICEVAVGRAKKLKPANITDSLLLSDEFRTFYDTILIDETSKNLHPNTQDVIIFHREQVLPKFVIQFKYCRNVMGVRILKNLKCA